MTFVTLVALLLWRLMLIAAIRVPEAAYAGAQVQGIDDETFL